MNNFTILGQQIWMNKFRKFHIIRYSSVLGDALAVGLDLVHSKPFHIKLAHTGMPEARAGQSTCTLPHLQLTSHHRKRQERWYILKNEQKYIES